MVLWLALPACLTLYAVTVISMLKYIRDTEQTPTSSQQLSMSQLMRLALSEDWQHETCSVVRMLKHFTSASIPTLSCAAILIVFYSILAATLEDHSNCTAWSKTSTPLWFNTAQITETQTFVQWLFIVIALYFYATCIWFFGPPSPFAHDPHLATNAR